MDQVVMLVNESSRTHILNLNMYKDQVSLTNLLNII